MNIRKIRSLRGFTLTELLVVIVIVVLLTAAVAAGSSAAIRAHDQIISSSRASMLSSSLNTELVDSLRFARDVKDENGQISFYCQRYRADVYVDNNTEGHIVFVCDDADDPNYGIYRVLSASAYDGLTATAELCYEAGVFTLKITVLKGSDVLNESEVRVSPICAGST